MDRDLKLKATIEFILERVIEHEGVGLLRALLIDRPGLLKAVGPAETMDHLLGLPKVSQSPA